MGTSLTDLLSPPDQAHESGKMYGVVVGIVVNNKDPEKMGRVKVKFPWLSNDDESGWARVATMMAGAGRGSWFLPEVDDEVLVGFEHGDVRFPYVVGGLWNGKDAPPANNDDGKNNIRTIQSRSGHIVRLDDTSGSEKVEVIDKGGNSITIESSSNNITIKATGRIKIEGNGIEITSQSDVKIQANSTADIQASATMSINASGNMTIKGALVSIN
jgi:uncharacterized protein involved in type VI secretion and phage assembly